MVSFTDELFYRGKGQDLSRAPNEEKGRRGIILPDFIFSVCIRLYTMINAKKSFELKYIN